jgi:ribosomal protein S2
MEILIDASKGVGLEVNTEKTKYMLLSRHQNAGQSYDIKIGNKCFENVAEFRYLGTTITNQTLIQEEIKRRLAKFKYLGTTITNQTLIQEEIKRRLNLGNACYHSVQKLLSSRLLSKT